MVSWSWSGKRSNALPSYEETSSSQSSQVLSPGSQEPESSRFPTSQSEWVQVLSELGTEDLRELFKKTAALERDLNLSGPQSDDELHAWIKIHLGVDVPRTAVCEGHQAPFDFMADLYFEREQAAVAVANRGGSKTFISAALHLLNSKFKSFCESCSVGAVEQQALRCYEHMRKLLMFEGKCRQPEDNPDIEQSIMRETQWRNKSKVEVLVGTINGVNGPHPQKVHADEVELMDPVVFDESRNMSASKNGIAAQDWITSTRKRAHGPMQSILNEITEAERMGVKPPYRLYMWCIFETAAAVPECGTTCGCEHVVKGKWDDNTKRTFKQVCKGRLKRSTGWIPLSDVHKTFRTVSKSVWEAQQECMRPSTEGLVYPMFDRVRMGVKWYYPDIADGPVFMGVDFGATNPHSVHWYQVLQKDRLAHGYHQTKKDEPTMLLKAGTRVAFDEEYIVDIGNAELAAKVHRHERAWARLVPGFRVTGRFADVQARAARLDWAKLPNGALRTQWFATRDIKEQIKTVRDLFDDDELVGDVGRCPMWFEEHEAYHYPDKRANFIDDPEIPVDDFNHTCSDCRYAMENLKVLDRKKGVSGAKARPSAGGGGHATARTSNGGTGRTVIHPLGGRARVVSE